MINILAAVWITALLGVAQERSIVPGDEVVLKESRLEGNPITGGGETSEDKVVIYERSVLRVLAEPKGPSWAHTVEVIGQKNAEGKLIPASPPFQTLVVGKKMLAENSTIEKEAALEPKAKANLVEEVLREVEVARKINQTPVCPPTGTPSALPARDENWTKEAATQLIKDRNFGVAPDIVTRAQWGASPSQGKMNPMGDPDGIVIHHTVTPEDKRIRQLQAEHLARKTKKGEPWSDIGYHFIIGVDANGNPVIYEGRPIEFQGAHTDSKDGVNLNPHKIGIVIVGNFEPFSAREPQGYRPGTPVQNTQPSPAQLDLLGRLIQKLTRDYPHISSIQSHGQGKSAINPGHSACPGKDCLHVVEGFKERFKL